MADENRDWDHISDIFDRVEPMAEAERAQALSQCAPAIRTRIAALLASLDTPGVFERSEPKIAELAAPASLAAGSAVGNFVIDAFVGRGGMGEVYRAHRTDADFKQQVAIKLLRVDAAVDATLFARERRVLAQLDHPGIVRLIDGGVTPEGRPWFAMNFVDGVPIDQWCREHKCTLTERLRLFGEVCSAVSFAHANLVVHRDLKPSNILVARDGRVLLLDFGIAKLLGDSGDEQTLVTGMLMTPHYSSPEQLDNAPVTVATDIYALGIILYELLTGAQPWRGQGSLPAIVRRILADDPPPPSRVAASSEAAPIAAGELKGDLDAIVAKATRKEPRLRYTSVAALADDLVRSQTLRPVLARAGSRRYRVVRFLRRNALAVSAAAAVLVAILVGTVATAVQARRAAVERDGALAEAARSDSIVQMMTLMLSQTSGAGDLTVKQALDASADRTLSTLDKSARSGTAVNALSDLYVNIQDARGAYDLMSKALAAGIGSEDPVAVAQMRANLADTAMATGAKDDVPALLQQAEDVLAKDRQRNAAALQQIIATRAGLARRARDYDRAISLLTTSLPEAERAFAANDAAMLTRYNNLIIYALEGNRYDLAGPIFAKAARITAKPAQRDGIQAIGIEQLRGNYLLRRGDAAASAQVLAKVAERRRRLFGASPGLASDLMNLARARIALGQFAEGQALLEEARPMIVKAVGPTSVPVLGLDMTLAQAHAERGNIAMAEASLAGPRAAAAAMPKPNPVTPQLALTEALVAYKAGRPSDAKRFVAEAREGFTGMGPAGAFGLQSVGALEKRIAAR